MTPPQRHLWQTGISVFNTEQQARKKVLHSREVGGNIGNYIAALDIPEDQARIKYERTLSSRGHFTLWGASRDLLERIQSVVPV